MIVEPEESKLRSVDCEAVRRNIDLVAKLEEEFLEKRTTSDRLADVIGDFCGSMVFVYLHAIVFMIYILINVGAIPGFPEFDKFPFILLSAIVSIEAIFLSTFVLMKQNRMSRRAESRAHLDLQVNLLAEQEMTLVLQMLREMGARLGLAGKFKGEEIDQLSRETPIEVLASELQHKLPD